MGRHHCLLLLAVLAALCGCAHPSSDAPVDPATSAPRQACSVPEMQALEALYAATGGQGWRCGAAGRPCRQVQVPAGVTGAAAVAQGQVGLAWPFGLSSSWSDARCDYLPHKAGASFGGNGNRGAIHGLETVTEVPLPDWLPCHP